MAIERITRINGRGLPLRGNDIDTDRIIPARFLRSVSFEGLETHLFEDDIAQAAAQATPHPITDPRFQGASILVVNRNFGCGSSREHAPQAIQRRGFACVIGESYSEIFFGNSVAIGLPCVSGSPADLDRLQATVEADPEVAIDVDLDRLEVRCRDWRIAISLPAAARESFLEGTWDATALLLDRFDDVERTAKRLPYVAGWGVAGAN
jgi:3-isopropylmalate/(R)-2-methylmalate dehydratase small subunit